MDVLTLLFNHFVEVVIFLLLFGGSIGAILRWFVRRLFEHRERLQEQKNEELRLKIQLEQARNERPNVQQMASSSEPLPKDAPWNEQTQATYEMGYQ